MRLYPRPKGLEPPPRPRLFIDVRHGLCNRLRAMASAASIAQRTGRELVVVWRPDAHCAARLSELFDYDGAVLEDEDADLCRRFAAQRITYMEIEPGAAFGAPLLVDENASDPPRGDLWVASAYTLESPHRRFDDEQRFLRALVPAAPVRALLEGVRRPNAVAAHIRMATGPGFDHLAHESPENWPEQRHRELIHWRAKSQASAFVTRIDALIDAGRAETLFVAADLPQTYDLFEQRYGDRVAMLRRDLYDRSARQLQYALADLILLTAADLLLASTWSSFSDMAQRLARPGRAFERSGYEF